MTLPLTNTNEDPISEYLEQIPYSHFADIRPLDDFRIFHATCKQRQAETVMILSLGPIDVCSPEFIRRIATTYSLPTHKYINPSNVNSFKRFSIWLEKRNKLITGFTKDDNNYYLVASKQFQYYYSMCGFCSACGVLRCSPVWCICGHKELSKGWTSNNKKLDDFIKKSQLQTSSANEAYLEWIPFNYFKTSANSSACFRSLSDELFQLISIEISDKTDDSYYDQVHYIVQLS